MKVLPILSCYPGNIDLALATLAASTRLGRIDGSLLLAYPGSTHMDAADARLFDAALSAFTSVDRLVYDEWNGDRTWPRPQNYAWQTTARSVANLTGYDSWFYWEPDAVPLRAGWFDTLTAAYVNSGKLFGGVKCKAGAEDYMNGVGFYPRDIIGSLQTTSALYAWMQPFDVAAGYGAMRSFVDLGRLMHHERKAIGGGPGVSFTKTQLVTLLKTDVVFYHGCTDGSLHKLVGS